MNCFNNSFLQQYLQAVQQILDQIAHEEQQTMIRAAETIAGAFSGQKNIYVFGCTHSAILAEDVFYRAGAPAFWRPLWGPGMTISQTPGFLTSAAEHNEKLGEDIIKCSRLQKNDVLLVLSTSGKNAAPVAVAETAEQMGVQVIGICSGHYRDQRGDHSRIPNLFALSDRILLINNHVPCGDASVTVCGDTPMGPLSTIAGSFIMHSISALAVEKLREKNIDVPVFLSSNAPGGKERNEALLERPEIREAFLLP